MGYLTESQMCVLCDLASGPQDSGEFTSMTVANLCKEKLVAVHDGGSYSKILKITSKGRDRIDGVIGSYKDSFGVEKIEELEQCLRKSRGEVQALKRRVKRLMV